MRGDFSVKQLSVILALFLSLIVALLSVANNQPVTLNYLFGRAEVSAVLVILGAAILGALTIFLPSLVRHVKVSIQFRGMRNEMKMLKEKIKSLEKERDALLTQAGQTQEYLKSAGNAASYRQEEGGTSFSAGKNEFEETPE
jgi:lipopolysaccharide assembly protein A